MQKNPCRVDDPLQNPIDRETYEDAVSLEDGIYPITTDDNTIISSDMVKHGNGTVEDALNKMPFHTMSVPIASTVISSYYAQIATGLDTTKYKAIGLSEGSNYDEKCNFSIRENGNYIIVKCISSSYTIPANASALTLIYVDKDLFV